MTLSTLSSVIGHPTIEEDRAELVMRSIDGGSMRHCAASNDAESQSQHCLLLPIIENSIVRDNGGRVDNGGQGRGRSGECCGVNFSHRHVRRKKGRREDDKREGRKEKERE